MPIDEVVSACQVCASCCRNNSVRITDKDILKIQSKTNKLPEEFSANGLLILKEDGSCVFLEEDSGAYGCRIYQYRPKPCKDFPNEEAYTAICAPALQEISRH